MYYRGELTPRLRTPPVLCHIHTQHLITTERKGGRIYSLTTYVFVNDSGQRETDASCVQIGLK